MNVMLRFFERIHAAIEIFGLLFRTEIGRPHATHIAIVNGDSGRMIIRRSGSWDCYEMPEDFEE